MKPSLGVKIMKISDVLVENLEVGDKKAEPRLLPLFHRLLSHLSLCNKLLRLCSFCNLYSHLKNANYILKFTQDRYAKGNNLNIHKGRNEGHHPPYFAPSDMYKDPKEMLQILLQPVEKKSNCTKPEPDHNEDNGYFFGSDHSAWGKETKSQSVVSVLRYTSCNQTKFLG